MIVKHGKPTARLVPVHTLRKPVALAQLQSLTRKTNRQPEGAGRTMRRLRDRARY